MQTIRPSQLTDEEILRQVYLMGNEMLPKEWVEELCLRLAKAIDEEPDWTAREEEAFERGFEDGFQQGVEHANELQENK
jgi:hypothetical protein